MKKLKRLQIISLLLLLIAIGAYYSTVLQKLEPFAFGEEHGSYYPLLTDSLLAGHLDLLVRPSPQLLALKNPYDPAQNGPFRLFNDMSLYKGRYYLTYGVTPALLFFIPYHLIFGRDMSEGFGIFCEAILAFLFFTLLVTRLWTRSLKPPPFWTVPVGAALFGVTTGLPIAMSRPLFYEVTTAGALMCVTGALYFLYESFHAQKKARAALLILGSLFFGLAVGTRPQFGLTVILIAALYFKLKKTPEFRFRRLHLFLTLFGPWLMVVGALAAYNFARFQNPFEFGMTYSLLAHSHDVHFYSPLRYLDSLMAYLLEPPRADGVFPFLHLGIKPLPQLPPGDLKIFATMGILFICPFALFEVFHGLWRRKNLRPSADKTPADQTPVTWLKGACLLVSGLMFLVMGGFLGIAIRYVVDFFPYFLAYLIIGWILDQGIGTQNSQESRTGQNRRKKEMKRDIPENQSQHRRQGSQKLLWTLSYVFAALSLVSSFLLSMTPELRRETQQAVIDEILKRGDPDLKQVVGDLDLTKHYSAVLETSLGNIKCRLYQDEAPRAVANFIKLAQGRQKWYDMKAQNYSTAPFYVNRPFYAVDPDFMIETGDQLGNGLGGPGYLMRQEWIPRWHLKHAGQLVMSSFTEAFGSQFFITTRPTPWLQFTNTVFGEVTEGMDVVRRISQTPADADRKPLSPVILKNIVIVQE